MNYDLEERAAKFGEDIIKFVKTLPYNDFNKPLVSQIIRSATSIGANYMEANQASSKKDFKNKIRISQKEANETKHWLRMLNAAASEKQDELRRLWKECQELTLIFQKITTTLRDRN